MSHSLALYCPVVSQFVFSLTLYPRVTNGILEFHIVFQSCTLYVRVAHCIPESHIVSHSFTLCPRVLQCVPEYEIVSPDLCIVFQSFTLDTESHIVSQSLRLCPRASIQIFPRLTLQPAGCAQLRLKGPDIFQKKISRPVIPDVTLAYADPAILQCWEELVRQGAKCSLLLKHSNALWGSIMLTGLSLFLQLKLVKHK